MKAFNRGVNRRPWRQVRCITERHEPRPGGELVATIRPCVFKTVQVSHNGGVYWSTASANVRFLFCDIYVSTTGSDVAGHGTPDRPYATLQRGIEAALGNPRSYYAYAPKDFTSVSYGDFLFLLALSRSRAHTRIIAILRVCLSNPLSCSCFRLCAAAFGGKQMCEKTCR